ncbi:MAG: hypothetical protein GXO37_07280 [Chloroflexi bacterium]|nr:hypothetical protein [Chloroflexota bacterium]
MSGQWGVVSEEWGAARCAVRQGSREKLRAALAQVPAREPLPHDASDTDA